MTLPLPLLRDLAIASHADAWQTLAGLALDVFSRPIDPSNAASEVSRREREIAGVDFFLATVGWDLWTGFETSVPRTADRLADWWQQPYTKKAALILDGLSLRELPFLLQGASDHGFQALQVAATAAELPPATTPFAQALGFGQRSSLQNDGAPSGHRLPGAQTECVDLPWADCARQIGAQPLWVFWHHWPDSRVHDLSVAGHGLDGLSREAATELLSDDFWAFIDRLATGRRVVVTSDHGYAASGLFADAPDDQAKFLRNTFKSGRAIPGDGGTGSWMPPIALTLTSRQGTHRYPIGRRKWKSQGGYPTLAHGGLTLLEVLSPFVELTR